MKPHFLFPASPLNSRMIDEAFQDQAIALKQAGFGTSCFDINMIDNRVTGAVPEDVTTVYRGWMMAPTEYAFFYGWCLGKKLTPLTDVDQYLAAHHLPNWLPLVQNLTPATTVFPNDCAMFSGVAEHGLKDLAWRLEEFVSSMMGGSVGPLPEGWKRFQLKDYVKSLKTAGGSVITKPEEIRPALENMEKYRGTIEGGIVVREYEDFFPNTEKRYFVINKRFYGQDVSFDTRAMSILHRVAREIPSPFFSVDIAERTDGHFRIVEIGDGQVSDLVGWTPERFAEIWKEAS